MTRRSFVLLVAALVVSSLSLQAGSAPVRARTGMVVSQSDIASEVGFQVIKGGGNAIDAAVATAFALAVTHPTAGNIGGGGFIVYRAANGQATSYDFREAAPAGSNAEMWLKDGKYDFDLHHNSHRSVGVPGTVAGLHLAWKEQGSKPWKDLIAPPIKLARDGFEVSHGLARSLAGTAGRVQEVPRLARAVLEERHALRGRRHPEAARPGAHAGAHRRPGARRLLRGRDGGAHREGDEGQRRPHHARRPEEVPGEEARRDQGHLPRLRDHRHGPAQLRRHRGHADAQHARGLRPQGQRLRLGAEPAPDRRVDAPRLRGPRAVPRRPRLRHEHARRAPHLEGVRATTLRKTINPNKASTSSPTTFTWPTESQETTHLSVVDAQRNAVSLTYTLEYGYGSRIVVPGAGFLLNNEMGDFNAGPGLTNEQGLIGTPPNLAQVGQAHALEHDADDRGEGRPALHGDRLARRPHHHQHGADDASST